MVLRWQVWSVLCLLVLTSAFAGCVSDEAPEPKTTETEGEDGDADTAEEAPKASESKALTKVDSKSAVFAPKWEVGQSWTYEVSGSRLSGGYTTTIGVVEEAEDHYVMGADAREFQEALIWRTSLMLDGVQKDSLAILQGTAYQDILGFSRGVGETWQTHIFNKQVTVTKVGVQDVAHAAGEAMGIRVEAAGEGNTFVIEYASDVEGITLFEWSNEDGTVLEYVLAGAEESGTTGLLRWEVKGTQKTRATGGFSTTGTGVFTSDGSGDHVFLVGESRATYGVGKIFDPDLEEAIGVESTQNSDVRITATVPDKAGEWRAAAVVRGGAVTVIMYQIEIVEY